MSWSIINALSASVSFPIKRSSTLFIQGGLQVITRGYLQISSVIKSLRNRRTRSIAVFRCRKINFHGKQYQNLRGKLKISLRSKSHVQPPKRVNIDARLSRRQFAGEVCAFANDFVSVVETNGRQLIRTRQWDAIIAGAQFSRSNLVVASVAAALTCVMGRVYCTVHYPSRVGDAVKQIDQINPRVLHASVDIIRNVSLLRHYQV